jgi:signal transduction histidine kinase
VRILRLRWWQWAILVATVCSIGLGMYVLRNRPPSVPYQDSFAAGKADEWQAFGGTWELIDGAMRNDSDERGAKLIAGSTHWRDYVLEADVQLLGKDGDAGLIARSGDEEEGVDSYSGYYAGLRNHDDTLVIGRANHGWTEAEAVPIAGGVLPFRWYHLKLFVVGCDVAAAATDSSGNVISAAMSEKDCEQSGRIGLRSYSSGGVWKNVHASAPTQADLRFLHSRATQSGLHVELTPPRMDTSANTVEAPSQTKSITQPISSLRLASPNSSTATIRGVVVLTSPALYVQDSTGGAVIVQPVTAPLKVGDEIEVTGQPEPRDFSSALRSAHVRLLWARSPIPPLSVTASQAATGAFDATFIEVEGHLMAKESGPDNAMILDFQGSGQSFRAITSRGRGDALFRKLKANSLLRLRGICVVDSEYTRNLTPFVLLLRSADDIDVLAGPPWWSAGHLAAIGGIALILVLAAQLIYSRVQHWRLHAVLQERERLAHEMHDTIAQSIAGIGFQLQAIRNDLQDKDAAAHRQLDLACDLVRHSHEEARRSIATLRPESLDSIGLLPALDRCARRMVDGGSVDVEVSSDGDSRPMPVRVTDALFKIGQEAIANAVRHASPRRLTIRLRFEKREVYLIVEDNGTGFTSGDDGFGLRGMRKRADDISARLEIVNTGSGTRVEVVAPLPPRLLASLPEYLWQLFQERTHAQERARYSHSYRG